MSGPDFLCIGAPKTGTSWLFRHLSAHSEIWFPPVKELHYFDRHFELPNAGDKVGQRRGLLGLYRRHKTRRIVRVFARSLYTHPSDNLPWALRFFGDRGTDDWYLSLFSPAREQLSGEATTDYCALPREGVAYVRRMLPMAKIIFLMRNPVERAWSHAKMLLPELLGKRLEDITIDEHLHYLAHPGPRARGDYLRTLRHWENEFPPEQILIDFYDAIVAEPEALLRRVLGFLQLTPQPTLLAADLGKRVNANQNRVVTRMPEEIRTELARHYSPDIQILAERFGAPVTQWLTEPDQT